MKPSVLSRAADGDATRQRHAAGKRSLKRDRKAEGWPPSFPSICGAELGKRQRGSRKEAGYGES